MEWNNYWFQGIQVCIRNTSLHWKDFTLKHSVDTFSNLSSKSCTRSMEWMLLIILIYLRTWGWLELNYMKLEFIFMVQSPRRRKSRNRSEVLRQIQQWWWYTCLARPCWHSRLWWKQGSQRSQVNQNYSPKVWPTLPWWIVEVLEWCGGCMVWIRSSRFWRSSNQTQDADLVE